MRLVRRVKDPEAFEQLLERIDARAFLKLPVTPHGRDYYRCVDTTAVDHSFAIVDQDRVRALVECDVSGGQLARFRAPIEIRLSDDQPLVVRTRTLRESIAEIFRVAEASSVSRIDLRSGQQLDPDGIISANLLGKAEVEIEMRSEIDLALSSEALIADMRKGHRQQVRWGLQHLAIRVVDASHPDPDAFDTMREFHARVAGRVTRSKDSWDIMRDIVHRGLGSLVLGEIEGTLVAGSLVMDGEDTAYYATGVYDREHFDKPLSHATIFQSMLAAQSRGRRYFDVGHVPHSPAYSEKEIAIGHFKRGFSSRTRISLNWSVRRTPDSPDRWICELDEW